MNSEIFKKDWEDYLNEQKYEQIFNHDFPKKVLDFFTNSTLLNINVYYDWLSIDVKKGETLYNFSNLEWGYMIGVEYKNKTKTIHYFFGLEKEQEIKVVENFIRGFNYKKYILK